jgi:uncharacterized membrane protein YcaP (DUF421 family)
MIFSDWNSLYNTLISGILAYIFIVFLLRISGKRTLSKWNAFDFIVTIALGSSLATAILSEQVSLLQGILGFAVLIFMQLIVTWLSVRIGFVQKLIKAEPALLFFEGKFVKEKMQQERVTESEVRAALRGEGIADISDDLIVVLETDGSFSIIKGKPGARSTLVDVNFFSQENK